MPCEYSIRKDERLVVTTSRGVVTFEEVEAHLDALLADPAFDPTFDQLSDTTEVESSLITPSQAQAIGRRKIFSETSVRLLVAPKPHVYGLFRIMAVHQEFATGRDSTVMFRDLDSALAWLREHRQARPT